MDNHLDLKGCVKSKGVLCIPLPELIKLFDKFPYHLGKDFKGILEQAQVSDKIQEIKDDLQYKDPSGVELEERNFKRINDPRKDNK